MEYKVGECKDRIKAMTEHLKNVNQELAHTQVGDRKSDKPTVFR